MDLASKSNGGRVLMSSSLDERYPATHVNDDSDQSFWISTGLYPQELLIQLGEPSPVSRVRVTGSQIRGVRVEVSEEDAPVNFQMVAEEEFQNKVGRVNNQEISNLGRGGSGHVSFVKLVITSGYHDFCSVHQVVVEAA